MGRQQRRTYDSEFKRSAVLLSLEEGRSTTEVAQNLGISRAALYTWRHELTHNKELAFPGKGKESLSSEQARIKELERQVRDVEMERDILKKAVAIFSKPSK